MIYRIRAFGKFLSSDFPNTRIIEWEDGQQESVGISRLPIGFWNFKNGQQFETIVYRNYDWEIVLVGKLKHVEELPVMTDEEFAEFIASIPTTESLPKTDWD